MADKIDKSLNQGPRGSAVIPGEEVLEEAVQQEGAAPASEILLCESDDEEVQRSTMARRPVKRQASESAPASVRKQRVLPSSAMMPKVGARGPKKIEPSGHAPRPHAPVQNSKAKSSPSHLQV